jgi:hypothetical protein
VKAPKDVGAAASVRKAGMPRYRAKDHHLLLARADIPGGERLPRDLPVLVRGEDPDRREGAGDQEYRAAEEAG